MYVEEAGTSVVSDRTWQNGAEQCHLRTNLLYFSHVCVLLAAAEVENTKARLVSRGRT